MLHQKEELINLRAGASRRPPGQANETEHRVQETAMRDNFEFDLAPRKAKKLKEIREFSKNLTKHNLMQADIYPEFESLDFQDKVSACFKYRSQKLQKKQKSEAQ